MSDWLRMRGNRKSGQIEPLRSVDAPLPRDAECPNDPPCPHAAVLHDVEEFRGVSSKTCWGEGCDCRGVA